MPGIFLGVLHVIFVLTYRARTLYLYREVKYLPNCGSQGVTEAGPWVCQLLGPNSGWEEDKEMGTAWWWGLPGEESYRWPGWAWLREPRWLPRRVRHEVGLGFGSWVWPRRGLPDTLWGGASLEWGRWALGDVTTWPCAANSFSLCTGSTT